MKKSKLLQNSKDLLSRSFNPAKCKTSLRLAGSRLKLLRNKKEVQLKQMKREIAQLLESGQDQTARIRVEHLIREEKMMAAYDLLDIYCELVVARLPVIESQKNCPIDLKEAIASLVFAAPRCGDVPEFLDARKQFSAKYGKDFTTAATELRPQCGVGRMLVEKLSATAPDVQSKTKILNAIAEEHNVKWEPTSFGENDSAPLNDRLTGPSSFTKEREQYPEPPHFEAVQVQAHPSNNTLHSSPSNSSQQDDRTSVFVETSTFKTPSQIEARPPALGDEREKEDYLTNPLDRRRWKMEFKGATSAAQAAAESAERASMAARAAAELSIHGQISRQYSTESHKSEVDILKDEEPKPQHPKSKFSDASIDISSSGCTGLLNEPLDGIKPNDLKIAPNFKEDGAGGLKEFNQPASLKYKASADDNSLDHGVPVVDEYSQKNSLKEEVSDDEMRLDTHFYGYEAETAKSWPKEADNVNEEKVGKQHSVISSSSESSISDHVNIFLNFESDAGENPFVGTDKTGIGGEAPQTSSHETAALFFDSYDSDIDNHGFDKGPSYGFHVSSSGQNSPEHISLNTDSWSPRASSSKIVNPTSSLFFTRENSSPVFSENTVLRNDLELDSVPLMFDESDGPISESDDDMNTKHSKVGDFRNLRKAETGQLVESPFKHEETSVFESADLLLSSDDELGSSMEMRLKSNQVDIFDEQPSSEPKESQMESKEIDDESIPVSGERLNFGKLTGGFRHKGHNHLPFIKNQSDVSSSDKKKAETTATIEKSTTVERPEISTMLDHKKSSRAQGVHSDSDSENSEEESLQKNYGRKQALTAMQEVKTKSSSFFGSSDDSDLDKEFPKESLIKKSHLRSGISRRTKGSSVSEARSEAVDSDAAIARKPTTSKFETRKKNESHRKNSSKWQTHEQPTSVPAKSNFLGPPENPASAKSTSVMKQESEAHDSDASLGKKPSSSYSADTRQEFESRMNSSRLGISEQLTPAKVAHKATQSSLLGTLEKPKSGKATAITMQESVCQKSSIGEEPSSHQPKAETSIASEDTSSNKDETAKKASHVHPKLPDYDTLFQSLRMNRS